MYMYTYVLLCSASAAHSTVSLRCGSNTTQMDKWTTAEGVIAQGQAGRVGLSLFQVRGIRT